MEGSTETRKARLMITKMVLENFKSYAGCQEIGPFHKRFSSIVGPNGSGKSNVIDALLFVFGKKAKQLRLNKVSELIHKSATYPNLDFTRVAVHFQLIYDIEESDDDYEMIPGSEFVVNRTAYPNNQSKYTVDGKNTTYTEVGLLLRSHGIDLDNNRFLILQGEVEQIAMMKPKALTPHEEGLLEYLEDIIGSNKFVEPIAEVSKALDEIVEQRVEKVNRLKISEKERDNLSGSKLEAEAFIAKEKEIRREQNILFQLLEAAASSQGAELTAKLEKVQEKLVTEKSKLGDSEKRLALISAEYEKIKGEHNKVDQELQKSSTQYDAFERNDVKLQEDMKHAKTLIKKQQAAIAKEEKKEEESMKEANEIKVQMGKYEALTLDFQAKKADEEAQLEKIMEGLQEATADLRAQLEVAQTNLMVQEKAVASLQTEKESVATTVSLLQSRAEKAVKTRTQQEEKLQKLYADRDALQLNVSDLEQHKNAELLKNIQQREMIIQECVAEENRLSVSIREAVTRAELAKATLQSQQSRTGGSVLVHKLMQAAKRGGALQAAGVHGRLGDLGTIPSEYDCAVSTACGMLESIVVDTAAGAQQCISFLREFNLGRATFIALDQMAEWRDKMAQSVSIPAGTHRLFDLVDCDAAIKPAMYLALRDTIVATDLDTAVKVAYVGDRAMFRVVTLTGDVIEMSGAMSGGGKENRTGGMKLANSTTSAKSVAGGRKAAATTSAEHDEEVTPLHVQQLEATVAALQSQLSTVRANKATAERELAGFTKQYATNATDIEKYKLQLSRYGEQENEILVRIQEIAAECALSPAEQEQVSLNTARLNEIETQIGVVSPNFRTMQTEVASLQRQILSVGGPKLTKIQSKIDSITAQLDSFSSNLSTKSVEYNNANKNVEKAGLARGKAEADLQKAENKLAELVAQQKMMETDALEVVQAVEAAREKMVTLEEQLSTSSKEYNELKAAVAKVKTVEVDLTVELERVSAELKECTKTAKRWSQEAAAVRKVHVDEQKEFLAVVKSVVGAAGLPSNAAAGAVAGGDAEAEAGAMDVCEDSAAVEEEDSGVEHLPVYTAEELNRFDADECKKNIANMEGIKNKMKGSVNMSALLEYMKKDANYKVRLYELEQVTEQRNNIRRQYEDLRRQRLEAFMAGFGVISLKLKEMYQMITLGGDAELELLDSLDPFSEGIVFSVRPPRKSWKNISNLSGGEKTLSSLALVFALHHYKPTPLYVMDEIDAALDFKNVSIVANYIKDRTKDAQFIIISLRNNMFELADRLVGIYKTHDATKSVTINPKLFENATQGVKRVSLNDNAAATASGSGAAGKKVLADVTNTTA